MRFKKSASLIVTLMAVGVSCASAQMPPSKGAASAPTGELRRSSNRYLLIVDTSRSMRERTNAIGDLVKTVLLSGMNGQMRPGDTLGVWTYNDHLYSGQFPLQLWTPDRVRDITMQTLLFVEHQKYKYKSDLGTVMSDLLPLIKRSDFITVILLTDGSDEIHGTPFDKKINEFFRSWKDRQARLKMPIVVFLRGQNGKLTDYRVSTPPWPLDSLPPPPPLKPVPVKNAQAAPSSVVKPQPRRMLPPLIVHGSQSVPTDTTSQPSKETATKSSISTELDGTLKVKAATLPAEQATQQKEFTAPSVQPKPTPGDTMPPAEEKVKPKPEKPVVEKRSLTNAVVPPVQGTISTDTESFFRQKRTWIAGLVLLTVFFGVLLMLARRSQGGTRVSLITRSLDQDDNQSRF